MVEHSKVAVIGAGAVGSTLAQRIAETNLADVVLLDIVQGRPQGVALDLMEARAVERHDRSIAGTQDYGDIAGADIVVITAGRPRTPDMTRDDLLEINSGIVATVARQAIAQAPDAIYITVTNPLDVMAHLVGQVGQLPRERFMGMAGVLDAARFATFIAMELNVSAVDVSAMVLGGHGDLMLPLARYTTVGGGAAAGVDGGGHDRSHYGADASGRGGDWAVVEDGECVLCAVGVGGGDGGYDFARSASHVARVCCSGRGVRTGRVVFGGCRFSWGRVE